MGNINDNTQKDDGEYMTAGLGGQEGEVVIFITSVTIRLSVPCGRLDDEGS